MISQKDELLVTVAQGGICAQLDLGDRCYWHTWSHPRATSYLFSYFAPLQNAERSHACSQLVGQYR